MWNYAQGKKGRNLFFGDSQLPSQIARTRVRLLYMVKIFNDFNSLIVEALFKSSESEPLHLSHSTLKIYTDNFLTNNMLIANFVNLKV